MARLLSKNSQNFTIRNAGYGSVAAGKQYNSASEVPAAVGKETAADFSLREFTEIVQRLEIVSNRLSAAKRRLQDHFGVASEASASFDQPAPFQPGMDGTRRQLDAIDNRLHSIADGMEELI